MFDAGQRPNRVDIIIGNSSGRTPDRRSNLNEEFVLSKRVSTI